VPRLLQKEFARSAGLLRGCETENDMLATLVSRIGHLQELASLSQAFSQTLTPPYLGLRHPPPDVSNPALRHTLGGYSDPVDGCAISADGSLIVTASGDHTLRVWDAHSGDPMAILGVNGPLMDCACSGDGQHIVAVGKRGIYFLRLVR